MWTTLWLACGSPDPEPTTGATADTAEEPDGTDTGGPDTNPIANCTVTSVTDDEDDGTIDATRTLRFDAEGLAIEQVSDVTGEPIFTAIVWDDRGRRLSRAFDDDGDGETDRIWSETWTEGARPGVDGLTEDYGSQCFDQDADGDCEVHWRTEHDANTGLRTLFEEDADEDGVYESSCTYTYDRDRRASYTCKGPFGPSGIYAFANDDGIDYVLATDADSNGVVDSITEKRFDTLQRIIYFREDSDNDGVDDIIENTMYSADGRIEEANGVITVPGVGSGDFRRIFRYDALGRESEIVFGIDVLGGPEPEYLSRTTNTWTCP